MHYSVNPKYIRENPYRLLVRRDNPKYFSRLQHLTIAGRDYQAYGNLQLLDNPFKEAVAVHRADTEQQRLDNRSQWLHTAANGGVLVSPFISPAEKAIRAEAEALGANIILAVHEAFGERYKPAGHDFELCTQGRMLIISYGLPPGSELTRPVCLQMNALAKALALPGSGVSSLCGAGCR